MINDLESRQILSLSREGMNSAQISAALSISEEVVKLVLTRHNAGSPEDRDIDDEELSKLRRRAVDLALYSEDENVAARMTMFLIERDKPREKREISPIAAINNAIIVANGSFQKMLDEYTKPKDANAGRQIEAES